MELFYEVTDGGFIEVTSPYNATLPMRARKLGGRWNAARKVWRFSYQCVDEVLMLYTEVYGMQPAKRYQGPPQELYDEAEDARREFERFNPPRKVRALAGLKPGDHVNVTLKDGEIRELLVEKGAQWALDKDVGIPYAELELRTFAHLIERMFTPDGLLREDTVAKRRRDGTWEFPRSVIVQMVNQRLAELDKKVKMLMAERGPGIKPEEEITVPVDNGWDD